MTMTRPLAEVVREWPHDRLPSEIGSRCQDCGKTYQGAQMPCPFCGSEKAQEIVVLNTVCYDACRRCAIVLEHFGLREEG